MSAFPTAIRVVLAVSTLLTLLGPTIEESGNDEVPVPPDAEPSEPDERELRPRPTRRERRHADRLGALGARDAGPARPDGSRSTQVWFTPRGATGDHPGDLAGREAGASWEDWPPTWPDDFTTGASCEVSCIVTGTAHDNGLGSTVYLNVRTTTPVRWVLRVTNDELGYAVTKAHHGTPVTRPHASYTDLEPGTTYQASIEVEDAWGNVEEASGSFTTSG